MAVLAEELFATDLSGLSGETDADGDFNWSASAAMGPATGGGCAVTVDDANAAYGRITFTALGGSIAACSARWWVDPNSMTMADNDTFIAGRVSNGADSNAVAKWHLKKTTAGGYFLRCESVRDNGATDTATDVAISDGPHWINIVITKETSDGADNGSCVFYIDDDGTPAASHTTVDNFNNFALVDRIEGGMIGGRDAGTSGTWYTTAWKLSNDNTVWGGEDNSAPVNTVPGTQTCTFGTQKSVTGISVADTDTNLSTIRVQVNGSATCTVTLSGTTVSSGTNGTNDFTLSGTQANLNTAIGTLKTDNAIPAWPTSTATTTITITSTDSESAVDTDTITCNWTVPSGNGQKRVLIAGTPSQVLDAVGKVTMTPTTDFTGAVKMNMVSTTSTPHTDTDVVDITVVEASVDGVLPRPMASMSLGLHL